MTSSSIASLAAALAISAAAPALALDKGQAAQQTTSAEQTGAADHANLETGKNSFTENQARARLESLGFTHIGVLVLDKAGIWRGTADRGAMTVDVGVDFKGKIAAANARTQ